jgi:tRNA threonylcarbamoyladenosine biosynthesis protein TsaB
MKILALDTATEACSVALLLDDRIIAREMEFERGHAEHILPMVDAVLVEAGVALSGVDALAFGRGPGGFTGVRLAASVTQGLAFAAGLQVAPVSDLAAVAQRALDMEPRVDRVLVCNDARMQEVYWGCFERGAHGLATTAGLEHVGPPSTVELPAHWRVSGVKGSGAQPNELAALEKSGTASVAPGVTSPGALAGLVGVVGRGFRAYPELQSKLMPSGKDEGDVLLISETLLPRAHEIARLAVTEVAAGRMLPPDQAIPVYLRDDVARPPPSRN